MVAVFRSEKFDIVHVHTPVAALAGGLQRNYLVFQQWLYCSWFYFHDEMPSFKQLFFISRNGLEDTRYFIHTKC